MNEYTNKIIKYYNGFICMLCEPDLDNLLITDKEDKFISISNDTCVDWF